MKRQGATANIRRSIERLRLNVRGSLRPAGYWSNILIFITALQLLTGGVRAADKLRADLVVLGPRARTASSIPVEVRFNWDATRILEGRLEMEFREGNRLLGRYRSAEMALTTGEQSFRQLLPAMLSPFSDPQVEVQMKFVTAKEIFDLGLANLFVPSAGERSLAVAWCGARAASGSQMLDLQQSLRLERFGPESTDPARRSLVTSMARLAPEDLPAQPLGYSPFDMVVLTADAFAETRERQLQALARWVKGGGSVCVFPSGRLQSYHVEFLNGLADSEMRGPAFLKYSAGYDGKTTVTLNVRDPAFLLDSGGDLLPLERRFTSLYSGVGRSLVVTGGIPGRSDLNSPEWREAVAFLWKTRADQMRAVTENGRWETATNSAPEEATILFQRTRSRTRLTGRGRPSSPELRTGFTEATHFSVQSNQLGLELVNQLLPKTVRLIPFSALVGTLVLFLLAIGPLDYFALGLLRRRRYTWVLFPAVSIGFTVATVLMANHYLGQRDQRRSLIVVDVGSDGSALRWNRYELIFAARPKQAVTELKNALWASLDYRWQPGEPYYPGYGYMHDDTEREVAPPLFEGALPIHFRVSESIRQWRPELNRTLSFEPPPVSLSLNWRAVDHVSSDVRAIRTRLLGGKPFVGGLYIISDENSGWRDPASVDILSLPMLTKLCIADSKGLFSLVSQVSPTGGGNFEDLAILDRGPGESALVAVTQVGGDIVVYRRLYHGY